MVAFEFLDCPGAGRRSTDRGGRTLDENNRTHCEGAFNTSFSLLGKHVLFLIPRFC